LGGRGVVVVNDPPAVVVPDTPARDCESSNRTERAASASQNARPESRHRVSQNAGYAARYRVPNERAATANPSGLPDPGRRRRVPSGRSMRWWLSWTRCAGLSWC